MDRSKWEYKKLGDCFVSIGNGATIKQIKEAMGIPITRIETLSNDVFNRDRLGYANIEDASPYSSYILNDGDILMSHINSMKFLGRAVEYKKLDNEVIIHGMNLLRLVPTPDFLSSYAVYQFQTDFFRKQIKAISHQAVNQASFNVTNLKRLNVLVPTLEDQQRIVAELDCLNEMIALKQEQLKELDKLAQSIFYDMFGKLDAPQHTLKDVLSKMGSGATPSGGNQSYKTEGTSLIRSLNVHNNEFVYTDLAFIDDEQARKLDNVIIEENDVLLNITGASVARCCIVPSNVLPARVNQHVSILRTKSNLINSTYLCHLLISKEEQTKLIALSKSKAATREALPKNILEKYLIPLPPLELQQQFAEKIQAIEAQKELVKQSIAETQHLLDSRMDYYFD